MDLGPATPGTDSAQNSSLATRPRLFKFSNSICASLVKAKKEFETTVTQCLGSIEPSLPHYLLVKFEALFESFEENQLGLSAVRLGDVRLLESVFNLSVNVLTRVELVLELAENRS